MTTPTALDAERAVLGAMLLDPETAVSMLAVLEAEHFSEPRNAQVFGAVRELHDKARSSDLVSLTEHLKAGNALEAIGGASYLSELLGCVATSAHAADHAELVLDAHTRARMVSVGSNIVLEAESGLSGAEVVSNAQNAVFQVARSKGRSGYTRMCDGLGGVVESLEALQASDEYISGVPTGIKKLDKMLLGLQPGNVYVIAARPSMGKSSLGLDIARHATGKGVGTLLFSLEMNKEQLIQRVLSAEANVCSHRMAGGRLSPPEWGWVSQAAGRISELPLYIDDTPALTYTALASRARLAATQEDVGLIVIDYLQLMRGSHRARNQSKNVEVGEISAAVQALARELRVPVLLLSQLSRGVEYRSDKRPMLSDLRDSGSIEQDAFVVMFIYREGQYETDGDSTNGLTELLVRKNRGGPTGMIRLRFNAPTTSFTDWEESF